MPDKSCRVCGGELIKWSTCDDCRKVTQKICRICNLKTIEDLHNQHISPQKYKKLETKSANTTIHSYSNLVNVKKPNMNTQNANRASNILVVSGIIMGVIFLGMYGLSYPGLPYNYIPTETKIDLIPAQQYIIQDVKKVDHVNMINPNMDVKPTYSNCLGNSDGISLTITCPTTYGNVYKAVVDIPSNLMAQFENKAFNLRGLSITEHLKSVSIQYEKTTYEANFINS